MNKFQKALIATLALAAVVSAGIEVLGIEVLGIEVLANGSSQVEVRVTPVPPDGIAYAIMNIDGEEVIVDAQPVNPAIGMASVNFPVMMPGNLIRVEANGVRGELEFD